MHNIDLQKAEDEFRSKLIEHGLIPPDGMEGDGKIHRIDRQGKVGKKDGWYILHLDGIPAGAYGDWRDGQDNWNTFCAVDLKEISAAEYAEHKRRLDAARSAREQEARIVREHAAAKADEIWGEAVPCTEHPYLSRKQVKSYGLRVYQDRLVVPVRDTEGAIHSLEFISGTGAKLFLAGGRKAEC